MSRIVILCWLFFVGLIVGAPAPDIAKTAFASTVLVVTQDAHGQPLSLGSGFVFQSGAVVTNLHVIEGASRAYVKQINSETKYSVNGIARSDAKHDLVVLSVPSLSAPTLTLGNGDKIAVGDTVYAVGNPRGLEGTFSQGISSSIRKLESETILQITAPISPGSSGGPVLNDRGEVIGVAVATFTGWQNLNFAVPSSYLSNVALAAKPMPFDAPALKKRARSFFQNIGGTKSTAGIQAGQFLWSTPILEDGNFTISIRNLSSDAVKDVYCLVIFYGTNDTPVDFTVIRYSGILPGSLAKRLSGHVDESVMKLTTRGSHENPLILENTPFTKVEFRILNFEIAKD